MENHSQTDFQKHLAEAEKAVQKAKDHYDLMMGLESIMRDGARILNLIKNIELPLVTKNDFSNPEALKDEVDTAISQIGKAAKILNPNKIVVPRAAHGTRETQIQEVLVDGREHRVPEIAKAIGASKTSVYGLLSKMAKAKKITAVGQGLYRKSVEGVHVAKPPVTREMANR